MPAYALALLTINDRDRYDRYAARFARSLAGFDGRLLVADEHPTVAEGTWEGDKVVLIELRDRDELERWRTSPLYREISEDRVAATEGPVLLLAGIRP